MYQLKGFEHIKGVVLDPRPFDMERDLVTATMKKKRNNMLKYYQVVNLISFFFIVYTF